MKNFATSSCVVCAVVLGTCAPALAGDAISSPRNEADSVIALPGNGTDREHMRPNSSALPEFGTHLNGAWATPGVDGAGIMLEVMPDSGMLFFAWFTFPDPFASDGWDPSSYATVPGYSDQRWITAYGYLPADQSTRTYLIFQNTTGGGFDTDPSGEWTTWVAKTYDYGTGWLELLACDRIEIHYNFELDWLEGTTEMVRLSPDGIAQCAELTR